MVPLRYVVTLLDYDCPADPKLELYGRLVLLAPCIVNYAVFSIRQLAGRFITIFLDKWGEV